jgi:hypothetical protein
LHVILIFLLHLKNEIVKSINFRDFTFDIFHWFFRLFIIHITKSWLKYHLSNFSLWNVIW